MIEEAISRGKIEQGRQGWRSVHPFRGVLRTTKDAVLGDKSLSEGRVGPLTTAKLYMQRLREVGFTFGEIFVYKEYADWQPQTESPRIIDLGGDIGGFSALYWKSVAPKARVTVVEANPATAASMKSNFERRRLDGVEVINAAASDHVGHTELHLASYGPTNFAGERNRSTSTKDRIVTVPTIKISDLIGDEQIDLLKVDIEGGEGKVIKDLAKSGKLSQIDTLMLEFHMDPSLRSNSLEELLQHLADTGFSINNVHKSGLARVRHLRRNHSVDISSLDQHAKIAISFTANKRQAVSQSQ